MSPARLSLAKRQGGWAAARSAAGHPRGLDQAVEITLVSVHGSGGRMAKETRKPGGQSSGTSTFLASWLPWRSSTRERLITLVSHGSSTSGKGPAVSPEPPAVLPEPRAVLPEPRAVLPEPRAVSPEPPAVLPEPPAVSPEPPAMSPEPPAVSPEPRAVSPEPPAVPPERSGREEPQQPQAARTQEHPIDPQGARGWREADPGALEATIASARKAS